MLKKISFCIILTLPAILLSYAQEIVSVPEFGKVDISELQMKDCSYEAGVPAMHLIKYENVVFESNDYGYYKVTTERRFRIKIFNNNGFNYASVVIPYAGNKRNTKIIDLEAVTYNLDENGQVKISKVNKEDVFRNKAKTKNELNSLRFTFPDIKPGCIIEYRFTRIEKDSYFISPWYFQDNIPNALSACIISTPVYSGLEKRFIADMPVEEGSAIDESKGHEKRKLEVSYAMRNIPAFRPEPFMSSSKDYRQRVEFSLKPRETFLDATVKNSNNKWVLINSRLLISPYFGGQFDRPIPGTATIIDSTRKLKEISEKVNAVYQYVKKNMQWDKYYSFLAGDIAAAWKDKEGSSAEINIILLNLLRKAGVDCFPLVFSTRQNGKTDYLFPTMNQFNNVDILVFDGDYYYVLDGTANHQSYSIPPYNILNRDALIVDPQYSKWVKVVDPRKLLRDSVSIIAKVENDGTLKGIAVKTYYDIAKTEKLKIDEDEDEDRDKTETSTGIKIDTTYTVNKENDLLPLIETTEFHYGLPSTDDFYFLNLFLFSDYSKNPFTDSIRRSDVDFGASASHKMHMEIALSPGIKLEELTRNKKIYSEDTSLLFTSLNEFKNDTIIINSIFEINDAIFPPEAYVVVRKFFQNVYSTLNSQILLRRKEE